MTKPPPLADACPECFPGGFPATFPLSVTPDEDNPASLCADYLCIQGHAWTTWWDADAAGWPIGRNDAA